MSSKIIAGTTSATALNMSADTSGILEIQTGSTPTTAVTIDASQNFLVGQTTPYYTGTSGIKSGSAGVVGSFTLASKNATAGKFHIIGPTYEADPYFVIYNQSNVGLYIAPNANTWTSGSDEKTKDVIEPIIDAIDKISTLRSVIGKYKTDKEGTRRSFLIAQDVQKVLPEAVNVSPDGTLGLQYTDVIPLLVAAINELNVKLDAQSLEIKALQGVA